MIGKVELTPEQEKELKEIAITELKEQYKYQVIREEIINNWGIYSILHTMSNALDRIVKEELEGKRVCELDAKENLAIGIYESIKKFR